MKFMRYTAAFTCLLLFLYPAGIWSQEHLQTPAETQVAAPENEKMPVQQFFKDRKFYLSNDGSNFVKFTFMTQAWLRIAEYNPGTTINGFEKSSGTDIGIRRYRIQMFGQLTDRVFAYSQFGENNFNNIAERKQGFFVHDAYGEYGIDKKRLWLGLGLSGWNGLSRFASSSVGSILGLDLPLYQEATNDVTDQFGRKLSLFAKGKLGAVDYRIAMAQPMAIQKSAGYNPQNAISNIPMFSGRPPKMQYNSYIQYQFMDRESNQTPYNTGTYLGSKKVFNIGVGAVYQKDAMWYRNNANDTINKNMFHFAGDVFYDAPIGSRGEAISLYGNITGFNYGKNYIRNLGPMNPANGNNNSRVLNGAGIAFPAYGTGTVVYIQAGYKFKDNLIGTTTLMPYISLQHAEYDRLKDDMNYYDAGINWFLSGNTSKFTVAWQNRPVYSTAGNTIGAKNAVVAQYQVFFN